jgi:hypothetical protein
MTMPMNAYRNELPWDLRLDLLVDGELPEEQRRTMLTSLDERPGEWRSVGMRFLQRQTEKESVRKLMAGGRVVPVEMLPMAKAEREAVIGRVGWQWIAGVAAGLLIAGASGLVTIRVMKSVGAGAKLATAKPVTNEFHATVPGEVVSSERALNLSVPVVRGDENASVVPVSEWNNNGNNGPGRQVILVQPDGNNGYMVITVSMQRTPVY